MYDILKDIYFKSGDIELMPLDATSADEVLKYVIRNKDHFNKYLPHKPDSYYTLSFQKKRLWREFENRLEGKGFRLFLVKEQSIIGDVSLAQINLGEMMSAEIGYKIDKDMIGGSYATSSVEILCKFVLEEMKLIRISAHTLPENKASIRVLEKAGFELEGTARKFLRIGDEWKDHLQYSRIR